MWDCLECLCRAIAASLTRCPVCRKERDMATATTGGASNARALPGETGYVAPEPPDQQEGAGGDAPAEEPGVPEASGTTAQEQPPAPPAPDPAATGQEPAAPEPVPDTDGMADGAGGSAPPDPDPAPQVPLWA